MTNTTLSTLSLKEWYEQNKGVESGRLPDNREVKPGTLGFVVIDNTTPGYWNQDIQIVRIEATCWEADDSADQQGFFFTNEEEAKRFARHRAFLLGCKYIREKEEEDEKFLQSFPRWEVEGELPPSAWDDGEVAV